MTFRKKQSPLMNAVNRIAGKAVNAIEERERLRTALQSIADFTPDEGSGDPYQQIAVYAKRTARSALGGAVGESEKDSRK